MTDSRRRKARKTSSTPSYDPEAVINSIPIQLWPWPRIAVFVPQFPALPHAEVTFPQFWAIAQQGVPLMRLSYGRTDLVRNRAARVLLESNFTHVLMLDADHTHPVKIVQLLARHVMANPAIKIVGGLNFRRGEPYDPCAYYQGADGLYYPPTEWPRGLVKVDAIGTGSLLISREVFEAIEPPWFFNDYSRAWQDKWPGEDMGFCEKARAAGFDIFVDTTVTSPHCTIATIDEGSYRRYLETVDHQTTPAAQFLARTNQPADPPSAVGSEEVKGL